MFKRTYFQRIAANNQKCLASIPEKIVVHEKYRFGYTEADCRQSLIEFHHFISKLYKELENEPERFKMPCIPEIAGNTSGPDYMKSYHAFFSAVHFLQSLGRAGKIRQDGEFAVLNIDGPLLIEACAELKVKNPDQYFTVFQNIAFGYSQITETSSAKKIKIKNLIGMTIICEQYPKLMLGIKIMSEANHVKNSKENQYFVRADLRIASSISDQGPELRKEDALRIISDRKIMEQLDGVHQKLIELGCKYSVQIGGLDRGDWKIVYQNAKIKQKILSTFFTGVDSLTIKLNLRNLNKYQAFLEKCSDNVLNSILSTASCCGCAKKCGGITFEYQGKKQCKCVNESFRFHITAVADFADIIHLITFERQAV